MRWGVLATGRIATTFATDLNLVDGAELAAVASRTGASARTFAAEHGAERAYGSYPELLADPGVDIVYVATPHGRHAEDVMACLEAGKSVLCEKPITLNAGQARSLVGEARRRGLFLAEAMWMRCHPNIRRIRELVRAGACGTVRQVRADLGIVAAPDLPRMWDPALGASALLDIGVYPLTFASLLLGEPEDVRAVAALSGRGIDVNGGATLSYADGSIASVTWSQVAWSDSQASVAGDGGRIEVASRMNHPPSFAHVRNWESDTFSEPVLGHGLAHEIVEASDCVRAGRTESELLPLDETVAMMGVMDRIREQVGVRYAVD